MAEKLILYSDGYNFKLAIWVTWAHNMDSLLYENTSELYFNSNIFIAIKTNNVCDKINQIINGYSKI